VKQGSHTARRLPRPSELRALLRTQPVELDRTERRLRNAHTIADLRRIARRRVPRGVFDYVDGGAEEEVSLRRSREAFARVEFHPHVLRDVARVSTGTTVLGTPAALPLVFAPTGFTRLMHHDGEWAVARAAEQAGIPYALSTMSTVSIEDVRATAPGAGLWFQLYMWKDRGLSRALIERAREAGYRALVLTVDVPVAGRRLRDLHNGFTVPPALRARTVLDTARYPAWWANLLTTEALSFANFERGRPDALASVVNSMFDPSVTFDDLVFMRELWPGPLVIKGIQSVDDARRAVDAGVEGLVVSNHGGRQLDRAPTPLELLPAMVDAVGDRAEIYLDTGVRTGGDVVAAVALGARACMVGRAYLYGLMAGGERGVERAAAILADEVARTLQLLGVGSVEELDSSHAVLRAA
jgi:L-lactate dehydrogenase (cytochrome)